MTSALRVRRRFQIERLEERIVPDCLFWQGALLDGVIPLGAALGAVSAKTPHAGHSARIAALRASLAHRSLEQPGAIVGAPGVLPAWAEEFLGQIERELDRGAPAAAVASTATDDGSLRLDALLTQIDQRLSAAAVSDDRHDDEASMPGWAEELLLEIRREVAMPESVSGVR